ncbi:MAG: UvrD-helicase domain-containing protein [bacterium]
MAKKSSGKIESVLHDLNEAQRVAVETALGPALVLAGAGSGKTRVLTRRISYLLRKHKVPPEHVLAVTFTNKAAREMRNRMQSLLGTDFNKMWMGTFHSIFARILRIESAHLGYARNFAIYDSDDQLAAVKQIMADLSISTKEFPTQLVRSMISRHKSAMTEPEQLATTDRFEEVVRQVYSRYGEYLKSNNAMDFDDLITLPVKLFRANPEVLNRYQRRFRHILVDEFQDTNLAQDELVRLMGSEHRNVFVVGDDDQSIYRWRGAEVRNILNFEKSFPECNVFRLEQNYRSTRVILDAAHSVIKNNRSRKEKKLWTAREMGEPIVLIEAFDELDEARKILNRIRYEISSNKRNFQDFVVLYRTNAQSRAIEDALRRSGISYVIVGGIKFYERKEIKDFLAYLRIMANPRDELSLRRIINVPQRGVGAATLTKLQEHAAEHSIPLHEALLRVDEIPGILSATKERIRDLGETFEKYLSLKDTLGLDEFARVLNDEIGFLRLFKEEGTIEALNRYDNIQEMLSAISEFCETRSDPTLEAFLEEVALITDIDQWNEQANAVTLMTLHSAKGLEFPVVMISGLEEGLFPLMRSRENPEDFEEERRLFYVGLTRAEQRVYLSWARNRRRFTEGFTNRISTFVEEIDPQYMELLVPKTEPIRQPAYHGREYEPMPDYENESQESPLFVGCQVKHDMFGVGVVQAIEGAGNDLKLSVDFDEVGPKKLLYRYAQLEIL